MGNHFLDGGGKTSRLREAATPLCEVGQHKISETKPELRKKIGSGLKSKFFEIWHLKIYFLAKLIRRPLRAQTKLSLFIFLYVLYGKNSTLSSMIKVLIEKSATAICKMSSYVID
ncbi:MAG: hypothetical protein ACP5T0_07190 [Verrucomicrobiia bacterium]